MAALDYIKNQWLGKPVVRNIMHLDLAAIVTKVTGAHSRAYFSAGGYRPLAISTPKTRPQPTSAQIQWQDFFRILDLQWQNLALPLKQAWNLIGRRRKKIGYWVYMKYNLTFRKPPLSVVTDPSALPPDAPPI